ncbi:MAG: hypothetical protein JXR66_02780 [Bacteroidales bacterium]|nr:hypothetical protein [Bacteroidales bacterium]
MGTVIDMVSIAQPLFSLFPGNSIRLSVRAARQCLHDAGADHSNIGLLINTGIYRYRNTGEPAIAALIQGKITSHKPVLKVNGNSGNTFSFDLNNGGCGLLTAIEIIHRSISNGEISSGMVVTGDSEPFYDFSERFSFAAAAAAIILSGTSDSGGFSLFRTYSYPEYSDELVSRTSFSSRGPSRKGMNILNIGQKESYPDLCVDCAEKSLFRFLDETGQNPDDIDLIIPSQSPRGFANRLNNRLGRNNNFIELPETGNKVLHTAGSAFALKKVWDDHRLKKSRNIIFLTIGSGINVSITLYRN